MSSPRKRPNVIFAFSDEHRQQSTSLGGMPEVHTPNMAAMAEQGVTFTNCISNYAVCSPYRAILMTGRWPFQQGMVDNALQLSPDEMTLGKAFHEAGYATSYVGKWHLGGTRAEPFGFDQSMIWSGTGNHWKSAYHPRDGEPVEVQDAYNATAMTDQALDFVRAHQDDPFFLMLSWNPPHSRFTDPPEQDKALYPEGSLPYRPNCREAEAAEGAFPFNWDIFQGYHAHVTAIDRELGRLTDALDEMGLSEDTILVYTSDHGSQLGSQGVSGKRQPFEESIKVPFFMRWPGVCPPGRVVEALFGTIDHMPTLCSLAGVDVPGTCVGQDLSEWMRGDRGPEPESQLLMHIQKENASHGNNHPAPIFRGVTTGRYTYAVYPERPWCLFDNREDPYQQHNLIGDPGHDAVRQQMRRLLVQGLVEAEDPFVLPD